MRPLPPDFSKLRVVELSGKTANFCRRVLKIGTELFVPRSLFDPVMGGERSNFLEIDSFSNLHEYISKTINSSDLKLSPPCFLFNSEHQRALLQFINEKIVSHSVPEVNSVTIMAKIV